LSFSNLAKCELLFELGSVFFKQSQVLVQQAKIDIALHLSRKWEGFLGGSLVEDPREVPPQAKTNFDGLLI